MTLSPPRCSRLPGPCGPVAPALFPSVLHESPVFGTQDRIYCVPWCRRDKFTNRRYVDKATWREAFDHEAFHSWAAQGSAPRAHGPSPLGGSVPRGLFLPGDKGVDRPIRQGIGTGVKLAENRWLCIRDSVIGPAHNPNEQALPCAPSAGRTVDRTERRGGDRTGVVAARRVGAVSRPVGPSRTGRTGRDAGDGVGGTRIRPSVAGIGPGGPPGARPGRGGPVLSRGGDGYGSVRSPRGVVRAPRRRCTAQPALPSGAASGMLRETSRALCAGLGSGGVEPYPWG
jgi:hypothetical protein